MTTNIIEESPSIDGAISRAMEGLTRREQLVVSSNFWLAAINLGLVTFDCEKTKEMFRNDMRSLKQECKGIGAVCDSTEHGMCCWPKPCRITGD